MEWENPVGKTLVIGIVLTTVCVAGCSTFSQQRRVQVVDPSGAPIAGAVVEGQTMSMNTGPIITDAKGEATARDNIQGLKWINVSKDGYQTANVNAPSTWPLRVTLVPQPTSSESGSRQ